MADGGPFILGIGGSTRTNSSSEKAVSAALASAERAGARTRLIPATELELPMYAPERPERTGQATDFINEVARADGMIIGSPGYHGGISGLIKNALDYIEDLRETEPPYLHDRPVGCLVCAAGWQAAITTLVSLRSTVHALRGWPTPLGVAVNTVEPVFGEDGSIVNETVGDQLEMLGQQVVQFAVRLG
ncbi:MAG: NADPH-dependent FMN reductase [Solirubrobacterales bacterium]